MKSKTSMKILAVLFVVAMLATTVYAHTSTADLKNGSTVKGSVFINAKTSSVYAETVASSTTTYISVSATNCPFNSNSTGNTTCYTTGSGLSSGASATVAGTAVIDGITYTGATSTTST